MLSDPLFLAFGIDFMILTNQKRFKSMFLKRLGAPYTELAWDWDLVLTLLSSNPFNINVSREYLTMKTMFLLGLALGNRASELHSI